MVITFSCVVFLATVKQDRKLTSMCSMFLLQQLQDQLNLHQHWHLRTNHAMASPSNPQSIHDFTVKDAKGNDVNLGQYKGKVLIIVNVASQCGLTNYNYIELSQLYEKYKQKVLEILAFPCNQFGAQEPGSLEEIQDFVCTRFKAEFPVFDKANFNDKYEEYRKKWGGVSWVPNLKQKLRPRKDSLPRKLLKE